MKGIFRKCHDCHREGKDLYQPIENFYNFKSKKDTYCRTHHKARVTKKLIGTDHVFGQTGRPWPSPGVWPIMQSCGEKAECREKLHPLCQEKKGIWSLKSFNRMGPKRRDGTYKKQVYCVYCQSIVQAKYKLNKQASASEQSKESA
jgi:hypothetical protein